MYTIQGKYTKANIYNNLIDPNAVEQLRNILNQPLAKNTTVALMPDGHYGAGVPIGTTIRLNAPKKHWRISPTIVSGDIGCGVLAVRIKEQIHKEDLPKLDKVVTNAIPTAFHDNQTPLDPQYSRRIANHLKMTINQTVKYDLLHALGTLGSGNHFIEFDKDKHSNYWLVIHCGSRHFGTDILKYYMKITHSEQQYQVNLQQLHLIKHLKKLGKYQEIESNIKKFKKTHPIVTGQYSYLTGKYLMSYIHDMILGQRFAIHNRHLIAKRILHGMHYHVANKIESIHNYFNPYDHIMRKGSVTAHKGEPLIVPLNMRDGSLLCIGKGNPKWNYSAPHGAGRSFSRTVAKQKFTMQEYKDDMRGIYTTSMTPFTLDEMPEAYKPMNQIIDNISPTAKIVDRIKPVYNYKAH